MTKAWLRDDFLTQRLSLPSAELDQKSNLIIATLMDLLGNTRFRVIHSFLPHANKNEVDTWKVVSACQVSFQDVIVAVPYVVPETRQMQHYEFTTQTVLKENRWGIPEPDPLHAVMIQPEAMDVVIVPLLAFDKLGYRVGYGGGFYDRFLSQCRKDVIKIGLSFFNPVERIADVDAYDITMNYCVTPEGVWAW